MSGPPRRASARQTADLVPAMQDEGQPARMPDPRNPEVRSLAGGLPTDLELSRAPLTEQSRAAWPP